jgi:hypothetical protein
MRTNTSPKIVTVSIPMWKKAGGSNRASNTGLQENQKFIGIHFKVNRVI